jgi:hypothetical protein
MKTFIYKLTTHDPVNRIIDFDTFKTEENILVQIFCGHDKQMLQNSARAIKKYLPQAVCIGTTTDGEIAHSNIHTNHTIATISIFEKTSIRSASAQSVDDYENGIKIAKTLITDETKLLILFSDGTTCNGEALLKGIESVNSNIIIAGGMAGDNGQFMQTYILEGENLLSQGVVGVSLDSEVLQVQNNFNFNWSPIGIKHTINKVSENRVYQIDDLSAVDFYAKYLGEEVADALPATGIEFPLLIERNDVNIARAVIAKHSDNSLSFAGNLSQGDQVRLGFGNAEMIMNESINTFKHIYEHEIESFFIYSCMARRRYMPGFVEMEIKPFAKTATTCGFFTYGEFFHQKGQNLLLNQTLTVIALSEKKPSQRAGAKTTDHNEEYEHAATIKALTHLIQQSTQDYETQAQKLEAQKHYSQQLLESQKIFLKHAIHEINTPLSIIMNNIELYELEHGKDNYLSNIEASMKNIYGIYDDLNYLINKDQVSYPKKRIPLVDFVRSRIEFFSIVAQQANLTFDFQSNCEEIYLNINETKLQRIIDNNITNAIKYTREFETIYISLQGTIKNCLLEIKSQSLLIHNIQKVFDAYYRESQNEDGLGLGLNLVKQICDNEGIKIEVESSEDFTSFRYYFPKEKEQI